MVIKSYFKNAFWPNPPEVDKSSAFAEHVEALALPKLFGAGGSLSQNPIFEIGFKRG